MAAISIDPTVLIPAFATIVSSAVAGYFTFIAARHKNAKDDLHPAKVESSAPDHQSLLNASFNSLVDQLQEERARYLRIIDNQGAEIKARTEEIRLLTASLNAARAKLAASGILDA